MPQKMMILILIIPMTDNDIIIYKKINESDDDIIK